MADNKQYKNIKDIQKEKRNYTVEWDYSKNLSRVIAQKKGSEGLANRLTMWCTAGFFSGCLLLFFVQNTPINAGRVLNPSSVTTGKSVATKTKSVEKVVAVDFESWKPQGSAKQIAYVRRFALIAKQEHKHFSIPASITLAQGILESNCGESNLAKQSKNHFGIKCKDKDCKKGHCINFCSDTHKDFFMKYQDGTQSYRDHSRFLHDNKRYKECFKQDSPELFAKELKRAGYADTANYDTLLINLISSLDLKYFDK